MNQADARERFIELCLQHRLPIPELRDANTRYDYVLADASMVGLSWDSQGRDERAVLRLFAEYILRVGTQPGSEQAAIDAVAGLLANQQR